MRSVAARDCGARLVRVFDLTRSHPVHGESRAAFLRRMTHEIHAGRTDHIRTRSELVEPTSTNW